MYLPFNRKKAKRRSLILYFYCNTRRSEFSFLMTTVQSRVYSKSRGFQVLHRVSQKSHPVRARPHYSYGFLVIPFIVGLNRSPLKETGACVYFGRISRPKYTHAPVTFYSSQAKCLEKSIVVRGRSLVRSNVYDAPNRGERHVL